MKKLLLLCAVLLSIGSAHAASSISRDGSCAAATTTCTLSPTPTSGDLVVVYAYRSTTTAPSLPTGWTAIVTSSGSASSFRVGCQVSTGSTSIGTWTNATHVVAVAYKHTVLDEGGSASCAASAVGGIGGISNTSAVTSTTMSYNTITMTHGSGSSWVTVFGADLTVAPCTPAGTTSIASAGTGPAAAGFDTNGGVASFATVTCAVSSSSWRTQTIEILGDPCGGFTFGTGWVCKAYRFGSSAGVGSYKSNTAGDLLIACVEGGIADTFATPTDTAGNTWVAYGAASSRTASSVKQQCWFVASALTSASTNTVTMTGSATFTTPNLLEFTPPAAVHTDVTSSQVDAQGASAPNTETAVAVTTRANNELIVSAIDSSCCGGVTVKDSLTGGTSPTQFGAGTERPILGFATQASAGAITPTALAVTGALGYMWSLMTFSPSAIVTTCSPPTLSLMGVGCQ